jgi:hypothetical protein
MSIGIASVVSVVVYFGLVWASTWYDQSDSPKTVRTLRFATGLLLCVNIVEGVRLIFDWEFPFDISTTDSGATANRDSMPSGDFHFNLKGIWIVILFWPYILTAASAWILWKRFWDSRRTPNS